MADDAVDHVEAIARICYAASPSYINGEPVAWDAMILAESARDHFRKLAVLALRVALRPDDIRQPYLEALVSEAAKLAADGRARLWEN
ncbi:MAG: hypothetical protein NW206_19765 [Hyphomonadaceae bacterium]|nr:hypothetical protein [Hyphomonadaceae bacterium]